MPSGKINDVKTRLMDLISESNVFLQPRTTHVFGDWTFISSRLRNMPIVTVRISPETIFEMYGRKIPTEGSMVTMGFSAHVFCSNCTASGEEKGKYAQDLANVITTYLVKNRRQEAYGIIDIFDLTARESQPSKGAMGTSRIVIEGTMLVKRPDVEEVEILGDDISFVRGDDATFTITVIKDNGEPYDLTGCTLTLRVKNDWTDPDEDALITKTTGDGITEGDDTGIVEVTFVPLDTQDLIVNNIYDYDCELVTPSGLKYTILQAHFIVTQD